MSYYILFLQEVVKGMSDPLLAQAVMESAPSEADPVSAAAGPLPVTVPEERVEPKQAQAASFEVEVEKEDTVTHSEVLFSAEEVVIQEPNKGTPEKSQSSPVDDVRPSAEMNALTTRASETETIMETGLSVEPLIASEYIATGAMVLREEVLSMIDKTETEITTVPAVKELAPSHVAIEELISFETTDTVVLDAPVPVLMSTFDPLLNSHVDTVMVSVQKPKKEEQTTVNSVQPEDKYVDLLLAEVAPAEGQVEEEKKEKEEEVGGPEEPAEDLEPEINDQVKS